MPYKLPNPLPAKVTFTYTNKGTPTTKSFILCTPTSAAAKALARGTNYEGWFYYVPESSLENGAATSPQEDIGDRRHFSLFRGRGKLDKSTGHAAGASMHLSLKPRASTGQKARSYTVFYNYDTVEKWNNTRMQTESYPAGFGGPSWANGDARAVKARAVLEAFVKRLDAMVAGGGGVTTPVSLMSTPISVTSPPTATVATVTTVTPPKDDKPTKVPDSWEDDEF
jgi:hypothetical protein